MKKVCRFIITLFIVSSIFILVVPVLGMFSYSQPTYLESLSSLVVFVSQNPIILFMSPITVIILVITSVITFKK